MFFRKWREQRRAEREQLARGCALNGSACPRCKHSVGSHRSDNGSDGIKCCTVDYPQSEYTDTQGFKRIETKRTPCQCPMTKQEVVLNLGGDYADLEAYRNSLVEYYY